MIDLLEQCMWSDRQYSLSNNIDRLEHYIFNPIN